MKYRLTFMDGSSVVIDAADRQSALDKGYEEFGEEGNIEEVLDPNSKEYREKVAKRGKEAYAEMQGKITSNRLASVKEENPFLSSLYPYTAKEMAETGEEGFTTEGFKDVGSLPGRALYQTVNPQSGIGMTSEELSAQGNTIGAIATDPVLGWSTALAPLGAAAGGSAALRYGLVKAIPVAEAVGAAVSSTVPAPFLREKYGVKDLGVDALIGLIGGAAGAGLASLPKAVAFKRMRSLLAREGIEGVSDETLEQVYTGIYGTKRATSKTASGAAERSAERVSRNLEPQYSGPDAASRETARELILQPSEFDKVSTALAQRAMLSPKDPMHLTDKAVRGYTSRLNAARKRYSDIIEKAHKGVNGAYYDPEAWQQAIGDVLSDVKDIPGAVEMLAGGLSKGSQLRPSFELEQLIYSPDVQSEFLPMIEPRPGDALRLKAATENVDYAKAAEAALKKDAAALNAQGQLARIYVPDPVQLNVLGVGKAMLADIPSAMRSTGAALQMGSMGLMQSRGSYDFPYKKRLKDFYNVEGE